MSQEVVLLEIEDLDQEQSGRFDLEARAAAIAGALKLLGTYFSGGSVSTLSSKPALSRVPGRTESDQLLAALRLRVALSAAARLLNIVEQISRRPNFRYTVNRSESVGQVRGKLDLTRLVRSTQVLTGPTRWPIIDSHRVQVTPENVLLASAMLWTIRELTNSHRALTDVLPATGPESRETHLMLARLRRTMSDPLLANCRTDGQEALRRGRLGSLVGLVRRRVRAGHVGRSAAYAELVDWVSGCLAGAPAASVGDIDWSFYGPEFDEKLFEVWCLQQLGDLLSSVFYRVDDPDLSIRTNEPRYRWATAIGVVEIYFQRSIPTIDTGEVGTWTNDETGAPLRGIPDLVVRVRPTAGKQKFILVDPKLRQRTRAPTEEIYKILGYFNNFGMGTTGFGGILFYAREPDSRSPYRFSTGDGGRMIAAPLDPQRQTFTSSNLQAIVELIVEAMGMDVSAEELHAVAGRGALGEDDESIAHAAQQMGLEYLRAFRDARPETDRVPWTNVARAFMAHTWDRLSDDLQTMIATAVWVGFSLEEGSDYSGPVLGLAAAAESILWDNLLEPALGDSANIGNYRMFGQMLAVLEEALGTSGSRDARSVRTFIDERGLASSLGALVGELIEMNRTLRRPAAHRDVLREAAWNQCRQQMLAGPVPLLPHLASALILPASTS